MTKTQVELMIRGLASRWTENEGQTVIDAVSEYLEGKAQEASDNNYQFVAELNALRDENKNLRTEFNELDTKFKLYRENEFIRLMKFNKQEGSGKTTYVFCPIDIPTNSYDGYKNVVWDQGAIPSFLFDDIVAELRADRKISAIKLFRSYCNCGLLQAKFTIDRLMEKVKDADAAAAEVDSF